MRADNLNASDTAVVFGAGPIGLSCVAVASDPRAPGSSPPSRTPRARTSPASMGAEEVLDPTDGGLRRPGAGADRRTGCRRGHGGLRPAARPWPPTLEVAGFNARLVNIGIDVGRSAEARLGLIQSKQLQIRGTIGSPGVWPQTLRFLARTGLDLTPMVTRRFPLDAAPDAYAAARRTEREHQGAHREREQPMRASRPARGRRRPHRGPPRPRSRRVRATCTLTVVAGRSVRHRRHRVHRRTDHDAAARRGTRPAASLGPVVLGHEFIGVVEDAGSGVANVAVGDRVAAGAGRLVRPVRLVPARPDQPLRSPTGPMACRPTAA